MNTLYEVVASKGKAKISLGVYPRNGEADLKTAIVRNADEVMHELGTPASARYVKYEEGAAELSDGTKFYYSGKSQADLIAEGKPARGKASLVMRAANGGIYVIHGGPPRHALTELRDHAKGLTDLVFILQYYSGKSTKLARIWPDGSMTGADLNSESHKRRLDIAAVIDANANVGSWWGDSGKSRRTPIDLCS